MPTSIRLEPEIERRLDFLAASTGRSKAYYLRRIIERGIEDGVMRVLVLQIGNRREVYR